MHEYNSVIFSPLLTDFTALGKLEDHGSCTNDLTCPSQLQGACWTNTGTSAIHVKILELLTGRVCPVGKPLGYGPCDENGECLESDQYCYSNEAGDKLCCKVGSEEEEDDDDDVRKLFFMVLWMFLELFSKRPFSLCTKELTT